jgi:phage gp36-like protein
VAYATEAQAIAIYGTAYITLACDRDDNGTLDSTAFALALDIATLEMDGYLLGRYPLPLETPPAHFQKLCVDIAVYNAAAVGTVATDLIAKRYEAAIHYMELVAANKVKLELAPATTAANAAYTPTLQTKSTIEIVSTDRQFKRDSLKGLM